MSSPLISFGLVGNIYTRQMHFESKGDMEHGHTHPYDHMTLLAKGSVEVNIDGEVSVFAAPHIIWINAEKAHQLTALEDNTVAYCIHAVRDSGEIIDPDMIPKGSRPQIDMSEVVDKCYKSQNLKI
jgi:hypothetical protein